jgi:hypothetical protein
MRRACAGSTSTSTSTSTMGETAASSTGEIECEIDAWEPNDASDAPSMVPWDFGSHVLFDAFLCSGESDWYRLEVDSFMYDIYQLRLHALVEGTSWCGEDCGDPFLPDAPENTIGLEIYNADTLVLLTSRLEVDGEIHVHSQGVLFSHDLLIHIYGPTPAATFAYTLDVDIYNYSGEDECEC